MSLPSRVTVPARVLSRPKVVLIISVPAGAHHARDPQDLAGIEIEADVAEAVAGEIAYLQDGPGIFIIHGLIGTVAGLADLDIRGQQALNEHFLGEILHRTAQGDQTVAHDGHVGRDLEHLRQTVGDVDHADALALEVLDHLEEGLHLAEGQRAGGLVQDQEPRFAHHAAQDLHQLLLGNGQGAGLALQVERKAQLFHVLLQALFELRLVFMEAHQHVFQHRHVGKQHRLLRHQIDALCQRGGGLPSLTGWPAMKISPSSRS